MAYHISRRGIDLITSFEGYRDVAYRDIAGIWTIGFGTTRVGGVPVQHGQTITEDDAKVALLDECAGILRFLESGVVRPLLQHEVDALVSMCYNIGVGAFRRSTLRRTINANGIVTERMFTDWNKVRVNGALVPSEGLTRRRRAEYKMFKGEA